MQIASVLQARAYWIIEIRELDPRGSIYFPDVALAMVERYRFRKFPSKFEEMDETKGIEFEGGYFEGAAIQKLTILDNGLFLDTATDTDASDMIIDDLLTWAKSEFGIAYRPEMIKRRAYISQLIFHSAAPLLAVHPVLQKAARVVSEQVKTYFGQKLQYEPAGISIVYDKLTTSFGTAGFSVERRAGIPFEEGKYFSSSPLRTSVHKELLEEWEKAFSDSR